jgi:glycogen debranching enzyme
MSAPPADDLLVGDRYYILAASVAADLPKLVLKHNDTFLVADRRGDLPPVPGSEFGLYVDGTRVLSQLELRIHRQRPLLLNAAPSNDGFELAIDLTNPDVVEDAHVVLPGRELRITRVLTLHGNQLYQTLTVESFAREPHDLIVAWQFAADFVDMFEVRGHPRSRRGTLLPARWEAGEVELAYRGLDGLTRTTRLRLTPAPAALDASTASYVLPLPPGARAEITVTVSASTQDAPEPRQPGPSDALARRRATVREFGAEATRLCADHELFNAWLDRSRADLHLLLTETAEGLVPYAGIPWYVAPFGRDSLLTALQVLPFEPEVARGTLRFLARYQGTVDDPFTEQEPGRILHEYRRGELAACREIPFIPYYGTVDATPLFVILLGEYVRWTGDLALAGDLWPSVERALDWMTGPGRVGDTDYLRYARRSPVGLDNQGWKDAHDAIMHASGDLAKPPIAVIEAQAYLHAALSGAAELAGVLGAGGVATGLRERALALRARIERDFWMEDRAFYALALDGTGAPCRVVASNPGHCLWMGILDAPRAKAVASRLMADDMFTGWGVRTLSARERLYNPMSYHNGSVWPHDTAIAAAGLRRYGHVEPFVTLATALFEAVLHFDTFRMPELFCGFSRLPGRGPTRYPVACSPQAWAAGVVFQLVGSMLGLVPDALENRVTLERPQLPPWLGWLEVRGLRVHRSRVSLRITRGRESAAVELLEREGDAEVVVRR